MILVTVLYNFGDYDAVGSLKKNSLNFVNVNKHQVAMPVVKLGLWLQLGFT